MASREYSRRLGVISDEQLQAALDRFGLGTFIFAEPIDTGLFGQNLMLSTSSGDYVFRGAPHWNLAGEDDWQFQKERFFSRLVHESTGGPTVAWPYMLDEGRDIFGWGFALQPRMPGGPIKNPREHLSAAEQGQLFTELGVALAGVHTVELPVSGCHDPRTDSIVPLHVPYADYVEETIERLLSMSVGASSATSDDDVAWARSVLQEAREALSMPFQPTVVHLDFGLHNVLWEQRDGAWRLTAVIDWMTAEAGHPESDLSRPLAVAMQDRLAGREEFLAAYFERRPRLPGFEARFPAFMLWERLLIWSYWQTHKGFKEGLGMRTWMEPFVRMEL